MTRRFGPSVKAAPKPICTTGEMNTPIVFCKSSRQPDDTTGFVQTLSKYGRAWARLTFGARRRQDGENKDAKFSHRFLIRHPGWEPNLNDYVVSQRSLCQIISTKILGERGEWLQVDATELMSIDSAPFLADTTVNSVPTKATLIVNVEPSPATPETTATDYNNSFWEDAPPSPP